MARYKATILLWLVRPMVLIPKDFHRVYHRRTMANILLSRPQCKVVRLLLVLTQWGMVLQHILVTLVTPVG